MALLVSFHETLKLRKKPLLFINIIFFSLYNGLERKISKTSLLMSALIKNGMVRKCSRDCLFSIITEIFLLLLMMLKLLLNNKSIQFLSCFFAGVIAVRETKLRCNTFS